MWTQNTNNTQLKFVTVDQHELMYRCQASNVYTRVTSTHGWAQERTLQNRLMDGKITLSRWSWSCVNTMRWNFSILLSEKHVESEFIRNPELTFLLGSTCSQWNWSSSPSRSPTWTWEQMSFCWPKTWRLCRLRSCSATLPECTRADARLTKQHCWHHSSVI